MAFFSLILAFFLFSSNAQAFSNSEKIIKIAQSQIGKGEQYGNNKGPEVKKYTKGKEISWCAGFVSWTLDKANISKKGYILSAKEYWNKYKINRVKEPRPGDVICFYRGSRGDWTGHVGIIEKVQGQKITTIEGNVGPYPAKVMRKIYTLGHIPKLLGFIRI